MARTIAFYGGSFNPPHVAHQLVCLYLLETQPVDEIWVAPTFRHAFDKALAPWADRLEMCRRAMAPFGARVKVSEIEAEVAPAADGRSYTLHTLEELRRRCPAAALRLVIGTDILAEHDRWHRWDDVVQLAPPLVVGRQGHPSTGPGPSIEFPAVSSTEIRDRLARGEPVETLVPRAVLEYIRARNLF